MSCARKPRAFHGSAAKRFFLALAEDPPSVLLAASSDSWRKCAGEVLKAALAEVGGRGGGSATSRRRESAEQGIASAILSSRFFSCSVLRFRRTAGS